MSPETRSSGRRTAYAVELEFAERVAREAGEIALRHFGKGVATRWKPDASPVTDADIEAERHLRARVAAAFPGDGFLGEEDGEAAGTSGRRWIVDPIDGTKSFVQGVPLFAVLVALEDAGEVVVGAVHLPALAETVVAARGAGCLWNGKPARVSDVASLSRACVVTTSHRNFDLAAPPRGDARDRVAASVRLFRGWGDAYGYVLVATGRAEGMLDPVINPWDIAPMIPIIEEAGGRFTDWTGRRAVAVTNAAATNGRIHDALLGVLAPHTGA